MTTASTTPPAKHEPKPANPPAKPPAKNPPRRAAGSGRAAARREAAHNAARRRAQFMIGGGLAAVVVIALVLALLLGGGSPGGGALPTGAAAQSVINAATAVPASVSAAVGNGSATQAPVAISGGTPLTAGGKPEILYIGAEYCPYCAAERWAMVVALSRFGRFTDLGFTHSSSTDVYPDTPTFTFHGSTFSSPYLTFSGVETATNQPNGNGGYQPLDTPTPQQAEIWKVVDPRQSFPFIDIGGRYVVEGATYDAAVLSGKSAAEIASALSDPSTPVAKAVLGAANGITAAICQTTGNQPAAACG